MLGLNLVNENWVKRRKVKVCLTERYGMVFKTAASAQEWRLEVKVYLAKADMEWIKTWMMLRRRDRAQEWRLEEVKVCFAKVEMEWVKWIVLGKKR